MSQSLSRALDIVRHICASPRTLNDVAALLDVHKSTALRLLQTLEVNGFARRLPTGSYVGGFEMVALAQQTLDQLDVRSIAHPHLVRLATSIGHTVHLAQLADEDVVYVDKVDGSGSVAMGSRIGMQAEIHTAAVAKVIVAHLEETLRARIVESASYTSYTPHTIRTPAELQAQLDTVRKRGWAEDDGEKEGYINCVAVPVLEARGRPTIGLSVTALRGAAPLAELRQEVPLFRQTANAISEELGWTGDHNE